MKADYLLKEFWSQTSKQMQQYFNKYNFVWKFIISVASQTGDVFGMKG